MVEDEGERSRWLKMIVMEIWRKMMEAGMKKKIKMREIHDEDGDKGDRRLT